MSTFSHPFHPTILREYDIRGTVGTTLSESDAYEWGQRFAHYVHQQGGKTVAIGRDGRVSSPTLSKSLTQGLLQGGVDVVDVGLGPTPYLYFSLHHLKTDAGIMVTGSHNPSHDNGFKMALKERPVFGKDIQEIANLSPFTSSSMGSITHYNLLSDYENRLLQDLKEPIKKPLKIAWDASNGAAGEVVERLAKAIPGEHILLNTTIDGTFPAHPPDPTVLSHMQSLIDTVIHEKCDVGIAFDGDADRLGVVDGKGRLLYGDQVLALLSQHVLRDTPGATIIGDVKASQVLFEEIERLGGKSLMSRTGHSLIKSKMKESGAVLAGEVSGHFFFADKYYGYDDGIYAAIRLISYLHEEEHPLSDLYEKLPFRMTTPELKISVSEEEKFSFIEKVHMNLQLIGAEFIDIDGVRVTTQDGWWLLRASNTSPLLVARCEATCDQGLENLKNNLNDHLLRVGLKKV